MAEPWSEQPSDLAPFVVAVLEQTETIRELRAQLDGCQKVEVTGPNGVPVYAQGSFQDGMFNPDSWDVQWYVGLEKVPQKPSSDGTGDKDSKGATIPLHDLSKIEIRLGGVLFASASSKEVTGTSPQLCIGNKFDGDNLTRSIVFRFGVEGRDAWLTFHFRGLPKEAWTNLQSVALNNLEVKEGIKKNDIYEILSHQLAQTFPSQTVDVTSISFCAEGVSKVIEGLRRGPKFEEVKREKLDSMRRPG